MAVGERALQASRSRACTTRRDARLRNESGFAIYWLAMTIVLVLASTALVVDLGYRSAMAERAQNAVDAAALGGTIFLPTDFASADARAKELALANGFDPNDPNVSFKTSPVLGQPTQLKVTVTRKLPVFLGGIVGVHSMTVTKTATADYDQPVQMGNPSNTFGNQPDCVAVCTTGTANPEFWANIEGPGTAKSKGNAFTSNTCDAVSDGCAGGVNADYQPQGELFTIHNANAGTSLGVELFDAIYAHVGDKCDDGNLGLLESFFSADPVLGPRYKRGGWSPTNQYCTGDESTAYPLASNVPTATHFQVFAPDATPWTLADNQVVPGCTLDLAGTNDVFANYANIAKYFRQWTSLCTIASAQVGDYILQVQTPGKVGTGNNNFSIRLSDNGSLTSASVSVFGQGRMAIYANTANNASTSFYLARVLPGAAGRTLTLDFFDTGDALGGASGKLTVLPPADSTGTGLPASFGGCTFTPPGNSTYQATASNCSVGSVSSATYNGKWVHWKVPIPANYSCDITNQFGCWVRINFAFNGGTLDVTSWKASLDGNPVRIVN